MGGDKLAAISVRQAAELPVVAPSTHVFPFAAHALLQSRAMVASTHV
jgi:hypothetical protein